MIETIPDIQIPLLRVMRSFTRYCAGANQDTAHTLLVRDGLSSLAGAAIPLRDEVKAALAAVLAPTCQAQPQAAATALNHVSGGLDFEALQFLGGTICHSPALLGWAQSVWGAFDQPLRMAVLFSLRQKGALSAQDAEAWWQAVSAPPDADAIEWRSLMAVPGTQHLPPETFVRAFKELLARPGDLSWKPENLQYHVPRQDPACRAILLCLHLRAQAGKERSTRKMPLWLSAAEAETLLVWQGLGFAPDPLGYEILSSMLPQPDPAHGADSHPREVVNL